MGAQMARPGGDSGLSDHVDYGGLPGTRRGPASSPLPRPTQAGVYKRLQLKYTPDELYSRKGLCSTLYRGDTISVVNTVWDGLPRLTSFENIIFPCSV